MEQEGESVDDFIINLYSLAEHCQYGQLHDEMVRNRIVVSIKDSKLFEKLQIENELTLEKAISLARNSKSVKQQTTLRSDQLIEPQIKQIKSSHHRSVNANQVISNTYKGKQPRAAGANSYGAPFVSKLLRKLMDPKNKNGLNLYLLYKNRLNLYVTAQKSA